MSIQKPTSQKSRVQEVMLSELSDFSLQVRVVEMVVL